MRKIIALFLILLVTFGGTSAVHAAAVTERPDIRIIIDGEESDYTYPPIISGGRTLLPLRELLANLGVENDDAHIIWNGKDSSVTAIKDQTTLYLKVGSTTATVNGKAVTIDAAPVNYQGRVYIPARFVAGAFDKIVAWDTMAKRVYMRDTAEHDAVKALLKQSIEDMDELKRCKEVQDITLTETDSRGRKNVTVNQVAITTDFDNKEQYEMTTIGDDPDYLENLWYSQTLYSKASTEDEWTAEALSEEDFESNFRFALLFNEVHYSALTITEGKSGEVRLAGDVSLTFSSDISINSSIALERASTEVVIDKATGYIKSIHTIDLLRHAEEGSSKPSYTEYDVTRTYSDFNGKFKVDIPADLK
jgi:hypothetical protein